jgi:hypothetical protein
MRIIHRIRERSTWGDGQFWRSAEDRFALSSTTLGVSGCCDMNFVGRFWTASPERCAGWRDKCGPNLIAINRFVLGYCSMLLGAGVMKPFVLSQSIAARAECRSKTCFGRRVDKAIVGQSNLTFPMFGG